jgi:predicted extracellular nuclease
LRFATFAVAALHLPLIPPAVASSEVVISQVYGGGGNSGAPFHNDFVELFNRGSNTVSLAGWSVQYASSGGSTWQSAPLDGSLEPGRHFLLQLAAGTADGELLPTPDATGGLNLSASAGKVALLDSINLLTGACPAGADIVDLVGYGNAAVCFEGSAPAPSGANARAIFRASGGCVDSDDNAADFFAAAPLPRNRNSPTNGCFDAPLAVALHDIQGTASTSPLIGLLVTTTTNVITGLRNNGFFLQAPDSETDNSPATSEAIFVSTPDSLPGNAVVGNAVVVSGIVEEFKPPSDPATAPRTQIINAVITLVNAGRPLPMPSRLAPDDLKPGGTLDQLERFEAMRVRVDALTVVGATEGFLVEPSASGISDGIFFGVLGDTPRPLREPGIPFLDPLPPEAPPDVPRFDMNPERLRVDSNAQPGAPRLEVTAGAVISNLVGVLDFEQRAWTLLPDDGGAPIISNNRVAVPVPAAGPKEFAVASFNLQRFFDATDDPAVDETVLTESAFNGRLNKASLAIRHVLRAPDILGVVEIENLATLETLANKVNNDALAAGQTNVHYDAWLEEGNDVGGIDSGFLVNTARLSVLAVTQLGNDATYTNPITGQLDLLNDRPPLRLLATVPRPGLPEPLPVTVILNHLRSLLNIDDPVEGPRVRAKRRAQAEYLARLVQATRLTTMMSNLVVMGDFNAFPFNDGYVDVIGTIKGTPAPSNEVVLASEDLLSLDLMNLTDELPPTERYSFGFDGNAQGLDYILIDPRMRPRLTRYAYARLGADFPESFRSNFNRPERLSDHDAPVAWFAVTTPPRFTSITIREPGQVELRWLSEPLQNVHVEASENLTTWTAIGSAFPLLDGLVVFTHTNAPITANQFYRLKLP